jgi:hypothetical protein
MRLQFQTPSAIPEREHPDSTELPRAAEQGASVAALIPIMSVVLIAFLIIGLALPVLPLHVHQRLGFGAFLVGLVSGSQFGASLMSRVWARPQCFLS